MSIMAIFIPNCIAHLSVVSLASILTHRLVLNLKRTGNSPEVSILSSIAFSTNSFVGNLGASFRVGDEDDEDGKPQGLGNSEHELEEHNHEEQAAPIVEDA